MKKYLAFFFVILIGCKPIEPVEFDEIKNVQLDNLADNKIIGNHRFDDGEEVVYIATGSPIGINTGVNVGFSTDKLSSGTSYFIANYGNDAFRLAISEESALSKSNLFNDGPS